MTVVYEDLNLPGGSESNVQAAVDITLWGAGQPVKGRQISTGKTVSGNISIIPDATGYWEADLVPNDDILPAGTTYRISQVIGCDQYVTFIDVPVTGGPYNASTIEEDAMNSIASPALSSHAEDVSLHAGFELATATTAVGFTITGTAIVPIPGLSITFAIPARPFKLEFAVPMLAEISGSYWELLLIAPGGEELIADTFRAGAAGDGKVFQSFCRVPNIFHNPLPGSIQTYYIGGHRITGTGTLGLVPDLFGGRNLNTIQAIAQ